MFWCIDKEEQWFIQLKQATQSIKVDQYAKQVDVCKPTPLGCANVRKYFLLLNMNTHKFKAFADDYELDLDNVNVQELFEDFLLRHRHLHSGNLSKVEKQWIANRVLPAHKHSDYQEALFAIRCTCARTIASRRPPSASVLFELANTRCVTVSHS